MDINIPDPKKLSEERNHPKETDILFRNKLLQQCLAIVVDKIRIVNSLGITYINLKYEEIVPKIYSIHMANLLLPPIISLHDIADYTAQKLYDKSLEYSVSVCPSKITIEWNLDD